MSAIDHLHIVSVPELVHRRAEADLVEGTRRLAARVQQLDRERP